MVAVATDEDDDDKEEEAAEEAEGATSLETASVVQINPGLQVVPGQQSGEMAQEPPSGVQRAANNGAGRSFFGTVMAMAAAKTPVMNTAPKTRTVVLFVHMSGKKRTS